MTAPSSSPSPFGSRPATADARGVPAGRVERVGPVLPAASREAPAAGTPFADAVEVQGAPVPVAAGLAPATPDTAPAGVGDWLDRLTDADPHIALVTGMYLGRMTLAAVITFLGLPVFPVQATLFVGLLLIATLVVGAVALQGELRFHRLPTQGQLLFAGLLDTVWLALGFVASGQSALPFPPLLVLALGLNGVLLTGGRAAVVTLGGALAAVMASAWPLGTAPSPITGGTQALLFVAVAAVAVVAGNRVRAAGWAVPEAPRPEPAAAPLVPEVLGDLPLGVALIGPQHRVEMVNRYAAALLGVPVVAWGGDADPRALAVLARADRRLLEAIDEAVTLGPAAGGPRRGEVTLGAGPGARTVTWAVVARLGPDVRPEEAPAPGLAPATGRAVVVLADESERRRAEAQARQAERYGSLADLSGRLAHEIRSPVTALRGAAQQMAGRQFLDPADRRQVETILTEAERLALLVGAFQDFANIGGGQPGNHVVTKLLRDGIAVATASRRASDPVIAVSLHAAPLVAFTDADLVVRVVATLVENAIQFSPSDERVDVRASYDPTRADVVVTVRDFGPGVPEDLRARIFQPFFTTRARGAGLGLAIAHRSATLLGGSVQLEPTPAVPHAGRGAYFVFRFPVGAAVPTPAEGAGLPDGTGELVTGFAPAPMPEVTARPTSAVAPPALATPAAPDQDTSDQGGLDAIPRDPAVRPGFDPALPPPGFTAGFGD